ncbi:MAG: hypothetical protein PVH85_27090 [Desulfobacterales bacterium]
MSEKPTYEELEQQVLELEQGESERKQIEMELHRRAEELAVLNALARRVSATLSLEKTCYAAVKTTAALSRFTVKREGAPPSTSTCPHRKRRSSKKARTDIRFTTARGRSSLWTTRK